jgi:hypothetical protein
MTYLRNKDETDEAETDPGADNTKSGPERNLIQSVALSSPSLAEANVGKADRTPGEQGRETRKSQEPVKDLSTLGIKVDESDETHENVDSDGNKGAATTVDVGEHLGSISVLSHGSQGTGATVNARHTKRKNRDQDNDIHEVSETSKAGVLANKHERRGLGVGVAGNVKSVISGLDKKADEEETKNEEQGDTPENLLDGARESLGRVLRLSSGKTNKLRTGKREGSSDEDRAESLETVLESTGVLSPVACAPVLVVSTVGRTATADKDERDDHESHSSSELEAR